MKKKIFNKALHKNDNLYLYFYTCTSIILTYWIFIFYLFHRVLQHRSTPIVGAHASSELQSMPSIQTAPTIPQSNHEKLKSNLNNNASTNFVNYITNTNNKNVKLHNGNKLITTTTSLLRTDNILLMKWWELASH